MCGQNVGVSMLKLGFERLMKDGAWRTNSKV
jgi:hypothetical protein